MQTVIACRNREAAPVDGHIRVAVQTIIGGADCEGTVIYNEVTGCLESLCTVIASSAFCCYVIASVVYHKIISCTYAISLCRYIEVSAGNIDEAKSFIIAVFGMDTILARYYCEASIGYPYAVLCGKTMACCGDIVCPACDYKIIL